MFFQFLALLLKILFRPHFAKVLLANRSHQSIAFVEKEAYSKGAHLPESNFQR
jgi:hypothetical protein